VEDLKVDLALVKVANICLLSIFPAGLGNVENWEAFQEPKRCLTRQCERSAGDQNLGLDTFKCDFPSGDVECGCIRPTRNLDGPVFARFRSTCHQITDAFDQGNALDPSRRLVLKIHTGNLYIRQIARLTVLHFGPSRGLSMQHILATRDKLEKHLDHDWIQLPENLQPSFLAKIGQGFADGRCVDEVRAVSHMLLNTHTVLS